MNDLLTPTEAAKELGLKVKDLRLPDGGYRIETLRRGTRVYVEAWRIEQARDNWDEGYDPPPGWRSHK